MTTWSELLANRRPMPMLRNSAHMLKVRAAVLAKYPEATIIPAGEGIWKLHGPDGDMSEPHNSEYACWAEAHKLMREVK